MSMNLENVIIMLVLHRKSVRKNIKTYLKSDNILKLEETRQVVKSFSIRGAGLRFYPNYVEISFVKDYEGKQLFRYIHKKIQCRPV